MKNETLISIIVPIYKVEKYLDKCIESIVNQSYKNLEIILVDDGSPDSCPRICDEWAKKDSRITVIHKENGGLSDARNAGLDIMHGEYVAFVDSDDTIKCDFVSKLFYAIIENDCDMSVCTYDNVDELGNIVGIRKRMDDETFTTEKALYSMYSSMNGDWIAAWNKLYKSRIFSSLRFDKGRYHEDWALMYKIYSNVSRIRYVNYIGYLYLVREGSIIHSASLKRFHDCVLADNEQYFYFLKKNIGSYNEYILRIIFSDLIKCYKTYSKSSENQALIKEAFNLFNATYKSFYGIKRFIKKKYIIALGIHMNPLLFSKVYKLYERRKNDK